MFRKFPFLFPCIRLLSLPLILSQAKALSVSPISLQLSPFARTLSADCAFGFLVSCQLFRRITKLGAISRRTLAQRLWSVKRDFSPGRECRDSPEHSSPPDTVRTCSSRVELGPLSDIHMRLLGDCL